MSTKRPLSRSLAAIIPSPPAGRFRCPHPGCPARREFEVEMDRHALEPHPPATAVQASAEERAGS